MIYVCIDGIEELTLEFFGYERVAKNSEFAIYRHHYTGDEQVVAAHGKRYLKVEDRNDAMWLNASHVIEIPEPSRRRT